jgi:hypothetical protein
MSGLVRPSRRPLGASTNGAAAPKPSREQQRTTSNEAAIAALGLRFGKGGVEAALKHPDFAPPKATEFYTREAYKRMKNEPAAVAAALAREAARKAEEQRVQAEKRDAQTTDALDLTRAGDEHYVDLHFQDVLVGTQSTDALSELQEGMYHSLFEQTSEARRKEMARAFQLASWRGLTARAKAAGKTARGNEEVKAQAQRIFDVSVSTSTISHAVTRDEEPRYAETRPSWAVEQSAHSACRPFSANGRRVLVHRQPPRVGKPVLSSSQAEVSPRGRPRYVPEEIVTQIIRMVRRLRQLLCPVYRHTVINYLMSGLSTHKASLNFAREAEEGAGAAGGGGLRVR